MTANEIIYAIREKLKAYTDDTRYTDDYLMFLTNLKRAIFVRREYNQLQRSIDPDILQTICMDIEAVNESDCPECYSTEGCQIYRTVLELPSRIELHNRQVVTRIAPVGIKSQPFSIVSRTRFVYSDSPNFIFATVHDNGHVYLKSTERYHQGFDKISVTQLFENPDDVMEFECTGQCYDPETSKYPVKKWMADLIISEITKELASLKELPADTVNNAKDETMV